MAATIVVHWSLYIGHYNHTTQYRFMVTKCQPLLFKYSGSPQHVVPGECILLIGGEQPLRVNMVGSL